MILEREISREEASSLLLAHAPEVFFVGEGLLPCHPSNVSSLKKVLEIFSFLEDLGFTEELKFNIYLSDMFFLSKDGGAVGWNLVSKALKREKFSTTDVISFSEAEECGRFLWDLWSSEPRRTLIREAAEEKLFEDLDNAFLWMGEKINLREDLSPETKEDLRGLEKLSKLFQIIEETRAEDLFSFHSWEMPYIDVYECILFPKKAVKKALGRKKEKFSLQEAKEVLDYLQRRAEKI